MASRALVPEVEVLLSTFNAGEYLEEQLDSLWQQSFQPIAVSIRDDGSTDETVERLKRLVEERSCVRVECGPRVGAARSYLELLQGVRSETRFVAFCDQDDVWLPGKIETGLRVLSCGYGQQPALYCGRAIVTDAALKPYRMSTLPRRGPSFANALVENIATGSTVIINRPAIDLLQSQLPKHLLMHDVWAYLVISAFGEVIYDPEPQVLYRQHKGNSIGVATNWRNEFVRRARRQIKSGRTRVLTAQAMEFGRLYGNQLTSEIQETLDGFISGNTSLGNRLRYMSQSSTHRQSVVDDLIFRALYLTRRV